MYVIILLIWGSSAFRPIFRLDHQSIVAGTDLSITCGAMTSEISRSPKTSYCLICYWQQQWPPQQLGMISAHSASDLHPSRRRCEFDLKIRIYDCIATRATVGNSILKFRVSLGPIFIDGICAATHQKSLAEVDACQPVAERIAGIIGAVP